MCRFRRLVSVCQQFVSYGGTHAPETRGYVFKLLQTEQMPLNLTVTPAAFFLKIAAAEESKRLFHTLFPADVFYHVPDRVQKMPRLRRQFVQRPAQEFRRKTIRQADIVKRDSDEPDLRPFRLRSFGTASRQEAPSFFVHVLNRPLMLMKQGDCVY